MKYFNVLFLVFFIAISLSAQEEKTEEETRTFIPREILMQEKEIYQVKLSREGDKVYFRRRTSPDTIFYSTNSESSTEKFIAIEGSLKSFEPTFKGGLIVVSAEKEKSKVSYILGRSVKDITPFPITGAKILDFSQKLNTRVAIDLETNEIKDSGVWLLDMNGGKPRRVGKMGGFKSWHFDDFFELKGAVKENEDQSISLYRKSQGVWEVIHDYPADVGAFIGGYQNIVSVSNDGQTIYATDNFEKDKTTLISVDVNTGKITELAKDDMTDLLASTALVNANGEPEMILGTFADARRHYLNKDVEKDFTFLENELRGSPSVSDQSTDGKIWLVKELTGGPITFYLFDREAKVLTKLFSDYPALEKYQMAERSTFAVRTRDSKQLPIHLYLPAGSDRNGDGYPDVPLPTIVYVHGGPWVGVVQWNSWFHTRNFQLLADRGYAVINAEFRGTSGLGKDFTDAGDKQWGDKMRLDLVDIGRWAVKEGIAEKEKLGIWGWSYGGYAANAMVGMSPDEYACAVSMYGPSDLDAFSRIPFTDTDLWRKRVGDFNTDEDAALLEKHSPIQYVEKVKVPVLLTTGSLDERVPQSEVDNFADALEAANKEVVYFYYPDEGHDYSQSGSWISFWAIAEQFLAKSLGGDFEKTGEDLEKGFYDVIYGGDFIDGLE